MIMSVRQFSKASSIAIRRPGSILNSNVDWLDDATFSTFADKMLNVLPQFPSPLELVPPRLHLDFYETDTEYHLDAEVPGVTKKDIRIEYDDRARLLTIEATKESKFSDNVKENHKKKSKVRVSHWERSFGHASRSITIPDDGEMDNILANYADGVVTISIPRTPKATEVKETSPHQPNKENVKMIELK